MFGTTGDFKLSFLELMAVEVLKMGPMPKHIALILDGNRRFARNNKFENVWDGHQLGFDHVDDVIDMFLYLGVEEMTIYVFSIDNFKRSAKEVDEIMKILKRKTKVNEEKIKRMEKKGIFYEFLGNLNLSPYPDLQNQMHENILLSKNLDSKKLKLNVAFIYTGRNEITKGTNLLIDGISKGQIAIDEVSEELLKECFTLSFSNPVDIMIRTSGEHRLSDYLLWGCSDAELKFIPETWPEFSAWRLIQCIFKYQHQHRLRQAKGEEDDEVKLNPDQIKFLQMTRAEKWNELKLKQ